MIDSKLCRSLETLNNQEWDSFRRYLLMYTGKKSDNYQLFDYLYRRRQDFSKLPEIDVARVETFNGMARKSFLNMMSRLFKWFEDWFAIHQFKSEAYQSSLMRVKAYNRRGLYKLADSEANKLLTRLEKEDGLCREKTQAKQSLYEYQYYSDNPIKYDKEKNILVDLAQSHCDLQKETTLIYLAELQNMNKVVAYDYSEAITLLENINKHIPSSELSIKLEVLYRLVSNYDVEAFRTLKESLYKGDFKNGSTTQVLLGFYAIAWALRMWGKKLLTDPKEVLELYQYGLESGILLQSGKIPIVRFHNIVTTISTFTTREESTRFIEQWSQKTNSEDKESTKHLALAQSAFHHDDYLDILELLRFVEYEDVHQKVRALSLMLVALYENQDDNQDLLHTYLYNFKRVMKRLANSTSAHNHKLHTNFIRFIEDLNKRKYKGKIIKLEDYNPALYPTWMTKKINKQKSKAK